MPDQPATAATDGQVIVPSRHKMQLEICRSLGVDPKAMGLPLLDPSTTFDNQPDGLLVLWCPFCLYSVTWTDADWATYDEAEWDSLRREASEHGCSVEHG